MHLPKKLAMRVVHPETYICLKRNLLSFEQKNVVLAALTEKNANMKGQPGRILQASCLHTHFQKVHSLKLSCKIAHKRYAAAKSLSSKIRFISVWNAFSRLFLKVCIEIIIFSKCMKNTENISFRVNIMRSLSPPVTAG